MLEKLSFCFIPTLFGFALLGWKGKIEVFVLPRRSKEEVLQHLVRQGFEKSRIEEHRPPFSGIAEEIQAYFEGDRVELSYPVNLERLSPFTQRVLKEVACIPYGVTITYGEIGKKIALPHGARAVGRAIGKNPVPLFIPCHRVVGHRHLGGFSGYGVRYKILLLSLELSRGSLCRDSAF
ncbi:MAG: methylated-DNA--[protein]-cysteine S-methyltransferase [Candidatus Caldatribacteriaceae bacterium]